MSKQNTDIVDSLLDVFITNYPDAKKWIKFLWEERNEYRDALYKIRYTCPRNDQNQYIHDIINSIILPDDPENVK